MGNSEDDTKPTLMRRHLVMQVTGLTLSSLNRLISSGAFPQPVKLSQRSVAWRSDQVDRWIRTRPIVASATFESSTSIISDPALPIGTSTD